MGYDKLQVYAIGVGRYFVPENPNGIFRFKNGEITGVSSLPAHVDTFDGYAEKIFVEKLGTWVTAPQYSEAYFFKKKLQQAQKDGEFMDLVDAL